MKKISKVKLTKREQKKFARYLKQLESEEQELRDECFREREQANYNWKS